MYNGNTMRRYDQKVLIEAESRYERYRVVEMIYNDRPARLLFAGSDMSAQSGIPLDGHVRMLFDYNQRFLELIEKHKPNRILILGGGTYTLAMAVRTLMPDVNVMVVELDDLLADLAVRFFGLVTDDHLKVIHDDAAHFLATAEEPTNVQMLIVDVFAKNVVPASIISPLGIEHMARHVAVRGYVGMNYIGAMLGRGSGATRELEARLAAHFIDVRVEPATTGASIVGHQNLILTGRKPEV